MKYTKIGLKAFFTCITVLATAMGLCGNICSAQVAVTVSPTATSNTYSGFITLNITGLTNGESVKVQTYLDLNSNGVVEANDPLIDAFSITDGGAEVIGGITNVSVPYDSNPATGAITTTLSFQPTLESVVGQKIYRVVSNPSGAFTPVTAVLNITNATLGQSLSGVVYSNGVTPLPNAVVVALTLTNQNYVSAVIADASGNYLLTLNPGTYVLLPALPGYYADQSLSPVITLTNGMSATNNLSLTNGTVSISGSVYDAGNSNTLGGVFLQAGSGSLFAVAFTDTNGNYTLGATSNNWKIKLSDDRLSRRGYLTLQGTTLTVEAGDGSVANADIGLYKGNGLFYGQVTITNTPIPNVPIVCNDSEQLFSGKGFTDANGNYGVVTLINTNVFGTNDVNWYCAPNTGNSISTFLNNYIFNQVDNVVFTNNQSYLQNFFGLPVTATISGQVVNNQGVPIAGLGVGASATIGGNQFVTAFVNTDINGDYSFGAASGQWYVEPNCCGGESLESLGLYMLTNFYIVNIPPNNPVVNIVVYPANVPLLGQPGKVSPSQFNLNLYGASGYNYTIQASTNLATTNWSTLTVISNLPDSPYLIQDFQATNSTRFYRAFEVQ